jgi:hypothetical protein
MLGPGQRRVYCLSIAENGGPLCGRPADLRAGRSALVELGGAVHGGTLAFRQRTDLSLAGTISDGSHTATLDAFLLRSGRWELRTAAGQLLGQATGGFARLPVPERTLRLALHQDLRFDTDALNVAERTRTRWGFTSVVPDGTTIGSTVPPLLDVDYGPDLALDGSAPRLGPLRLAIGFSRADGGLRKVTEARLWWSTDGGRRWVPTDLRRHGRVTYAAVLTGRDWRRGGHLSLRVTAHDDQGNSLEQASIGLIPTP